MNGSFDLTAFAADLERTGEHKDVVNAIYNALASASAYQDLAQALEALQILDRLSLATTLAHSCQAAEDGVTANALLDEAIILYARATDITPKKRRKWFGVDKLVGEHRKLHDKVLYVRSKELAHYGHGTLFSGDATIVEAIVMFLSNGEPSIGYRSSRNHADPAFVQELAGLVSYVKDMANDAAKARLKDVLTILGQVLPGNAGLRRMTLTHPIDDRLRFERPEGLQPRDGLISFDRTTTKPMSDQA